MGSIRLGKVLGFEVRVDYSWFLVFLLMAWTLSVGVFPSRYPFDPRTNWVLGTLAALLLFLSVLVHELSHALVARRFGIEVEGITLFLFGGVAHIKGEPSTPREEFLVAGIGPVTSAAIAAVCLGIAIPLAHRIGLLPGVALLHYMGWLNVALAVFNLVPGFPLDGGRILRALLWRMSHNLKMATRWATGLGQLFGWGLMAYGILWILKTGDLGGFWMIAVGWFLNSTARASYQQLLLRRALSGVPVAAITSHDVPVVDADIRIPQFVNQYLLRHEFGMYPVARDGRFVGVITAEDVRRLEQDLWGVTCVGALSRVPDQEQIVQDDRDAWDAFTQMLENDSPRLLVLHDDHLEGIVSREGIVRLVQLRNRSRIAV